MTSSWRIEDATYENVAMRLVPAEQHLDHDTIATFRQQHLEQLAALFTRALRLCQRAGLVKLCNVALDGTELRANASRDRSVCPGLGSPALPKGDASARPGEQNQPGQAAGRSLSKKPLPRPWQRPPTPLRRRAWQISARSGRADSENAAEIPPSITAGVRLTPCEKSGLGRVGRAGVMTCSLTSSTTQRRASIPRRQT